MSNFMDLTGERFGRLVVIRRADDYIQPCGVKVVMWECKCDCGNIITTRSKYLTSGRKKYCGDLCQCKRENLAGRRFGRLVVLKNIGIGKWLCKCDCGNEREFLSNKLLSGNNTSCGKCKKTINMIGERYGKLTVVEEDFEQEQKDGNHKTIWKCKCDCGNIISCTRQDLTYGYKTDCGCVKEGKYLVGKKFGKLKVIRVIRERGKDARVECECECGNITTPYLSRIINHKVYSCGCYRSEKSIQIRTKHGMSGTRLYKVWKKINDRCQNENNKNYKNYGGRGISICEEWKGQNGFENFAKWAKENGYDENAKKWECTIDRINNDGDYCPENCRWTDMTEQSYNKRNTTRVPIFGVEMTIKEISDKYGIEKSTLRQRINNGIIDEERLLYKGDLREHK